jgi:hypothetical protein
MLTYADVCYTGERQGQHTGSRALHFHQAYSTYADVCCRVLTYATQERGKVSIPAAERFTFIRHTAPSTRISRLRQQTPAYVSIRQHMSAYVSICQHTSAYVSIRPSRLACLLCSIRQHTSAHVSIRQHTSAYVSIRQHTSAYVSIPCKYATVPQHLQVLKQGFIKALFRLY